MTRYEAFIRKDWQERGNADIWFVRMTDDFHAEVGCFMVDLWCLGVKDAIWSEAAADEFRRELDQYLPVEEREAINPACARKLIEGAVEYAQSLGIKPHRDYRKARKVLGSVKAADCPETFAYGRDGKPFYLVGEADSPARVDLVLNLLTTRLGPDGFGFYDPAEDDGYDDEDNDGDSDDELSDAETAYSPDDDVDTDAVPDLDELEGLTDEELDEMFVLDRDYDPAVTDRIIDRWLVHPSAAVTFPEFCGLVTAGHLSDLPISPARLQEAFWKEGGRVWENQAEVQAFLDDLRAYWNHVGVVLQELHDLEEAYYVVQLPTARVDMPDDPLAAPPAAYFEAIVKWCAGLSLARRRWPDVWSDGPKTRSAWAAIEALADPTHPRHLDEVMAFDASDEDEQTVADRVLWLYGLRRRPGNN